MLAKKPNSNSDSIEKGLELRPHHIVGHSSTSKPKNAKKSMLKLSAHFSAHC